MLVMSQNKDRIFNLDACMIVAYRLSSKSSIEIAFNGNRFAVADYNTPERAKEVLNELFTSNYDKYLLPKE